VARQHWEMIRDGAPAAWSKDMVHVAKEIAAVADDIGLDRLRAGEVAQSKVPIVGDFARGGEWRDGLTERCCMSERGVSRALTELGRAGYEMRVQIGVAKNGEPVYAAKGHAVTFAVRYLPPRPEPKSPPGTAAFGGSSVGVPVENPVDNPQRPPSTATFDEQSTPDVATFDGQSPPSTAPKPAKYGGPDDFDDDDGSIAAAAAVAQEYDWPAEHAKRVAGAVLAKAPGLVSNPAGYVLAAVKKNPKGYAPDAARWRPKDHGGKTAAAKAKATKAEITEFRKWAAKQPPCPDGMPGGDLIGPDGVAPCPLCRQATSPESAPTTWRMT
jgi:hypothetical protein